MRYVKEPTYKRLITGELEGFDDRNTGFSRGHIEGNKYTAMHNQCIKNLKKGRPFWTMPRG